MTIPSAIALGFELSNDTKIEVTLTQDYHAAMMLVNELELFAQSLERGPFSE